MKSIINSTLKLLFRNAGFWFFMVITPIISTLILKVEQTNLSSYELNGSATAAKIMEIGSADEKVAYYSGKGRYVIKVYDASGSELSEYLLSKMTESGAFMICRVKTPGMTKEELDRRIELDAEKDRLGAALFLGKDFDAEAVAGAVKDGMKVFILSKDERKSLMNSELTMILGQIRSAAKSDDIPGTLKSMNDSLPKKTVETLTDKDEINLTNKQIDQRTLIGYAFAIMTLGFVFAGIFIAHTAINEKKDMVLTRIRLTRLSDMQYFTAKFLSGAIVSALITTIMAVCSFLIPEEKLGINRLIFILMLFLMGLIFCSLSLLLGILFDNIMSANIAAFTLWSLSAMLAGLYFPLDSTTDTVKTISYLMPQKWFLSITEYLMTGNGKGYIMILGVTAAYMVIILSLGSVGIKFRNNE
ncbi:MAG: ABC transporter permease [Eubacterium sp.]|nr:ABC transporter permease [Eubacterium sp.]